MVKEAKVQGYDFESHTAPSDTKHTYSDPENFAFSGESAQRAPPRYIVTCSTQLIAMNGMKTTGTWLPAPSPFENNDVQLKKARARGAFLVLYTGGLGIRAGQSLANP